MMPDLGKYAVEVSLAYGVSLLLMAALVGQSLWRAARVRKELGVIEARRTSVAQAEPAPATTQKDGTQAHG